MNYFTTVLSAALLAGSAATFAQQLPGGSAYESSFSYRIGTQHVGVDALNRAFQQAGYSPVSGQATVFGFISEVKHPNRPFSIQSEFSFGFRSGMQSSNGTYQARVGFSQMRLGGSYRVWGTERFRLAPQLGLSLNPMSVRVEPVGGAPALSLNAALTNPGSSRTASVGAMAFGVDAGLVGTLRILTGSKTYDDCPSGQRSVERFIVIGLDAGYRLSSRATFNAGNDLAGAPVNINPSGFYAGIRFGWGSRTRSVVPPTTPVQ